MSARIKISLLAASISVLAGCAASTPPPPPTFNPAAAATTQADTFIGSSKSVEKDMAKVKKVALTACNVMFADESSASASTAAGMFGDPAHSKTSRMDSKVIVVYTMSGLDDAVMQKMTDDICNSAEQRMGKAGLEVVPRSALASNESYQKMLSSGRKSPYEYKMGDSTYKVFSATGSTIFDDRYIGKVSGLGQAFKSAAGSSGAQLEAQLMNEMGIDSVQMNMLVDFAKLESDGHNKATAVRDKNRAKVSGTVQLSISGDVSIKPAAGLKCWKKPFGKGEECAVESRAAFFTKRPVLADEQFYKEVREATKTSDKLASGLTKGIALFSALGGVSSTSTSITRYSVDVEPAQFAQVGGKYMNGFMDMMFLSANNARTNGK